MFKKLILLLIILSVVACKTQQWQVNQASSTRIAIDASTRISANPYSFQAGLANNSKDVVDGVLTWAKFTTDAKKVTVS